jgi:pyruvate dehydrogenase E2 component (dihydrolipoamide acetyltransferase)
MANKQIIVPDIGDFDSVEVIEVLVNVGDEINIDDALITLESDKASMEIPATTSGKITDIKIKVGDKVSQGDVILEIEATENATAKTTENPTPAEDTTAKTTTPSTTTQNITIPDIGDFDQVEIIEILVQVGDKVEIDDSLLTLESDKASMEIPSTQAGIIQKINVQVGDKVSFGDDIIEILAENTNTAQAAPQVAQPQQAAIQQTTNETTKGAEIAVASPNSSHASPSVRKLARELGVDLSKVSGSGNKGRITDKDLKEFVKKSLQTGGVNGSGIPAIPSQDFAKFGEIEEVELSRINKISAKHLHACWLNVPHVTQFDEANIDELEVFRKIQKDKGNKFTPIVFIIKAVVHCLKLYPRFNSSLDGDNLIMKKYFNIGVAVDTPNGLMVPVIKNADKKSLTELQTELVDLAKKAREGKLSSGDLQGGCFSISSLGGIGGTHFTPIVNSPEVAILGVAKSQVKPVWNTKEFVPTTILPLSLSYDHRVIDGALGARFITDLSSALEDIREVLI